MNMSKINLNLLVALDALLEECNVSKAAEKLFVTQSAMSNTLKQLRELFDNELLIRKGRQLVLTHKAESLRPQIKNFLLEAQLIFEHKPFDPNVSQRVFTIAMEEYAAITILPELYAYLEVHAPNIRLHVKPMPLFAEKAMLEDTDVELAIGLLHHALKPKYLAYEVLMSEKMVCIGRPNHPLLRKKVSLKTYLSASHVSFMPLNKSIPHIVDQVLEEKGLKRDVKLRVSHIMAAIYSVAKSDLIATAPVSVAKEVAELFNFSVQHCGLDFPLVVLAQMWHPWAENDRECRWLRETVCKLFSKKKPRSVILPA